MQFWQVFPVALALLFILEGVLPFLSPNRYRAVVEALAAQDDASIRRVGLTSMLIGLGLLYLVN